MYNHLLWPHADQRAGVFETADVMFPSEGSFIYQKDLLKTFPEDLASKAKPLLDFLTASTQEKIVWSVHKHWSGFYDMDKTKINDAISINDKNIDYRVYNKMVSLSNSKPLLIIHNSQSALDYMMLTYVFWVANLKVPYRVTPLTYFESLFLQKSLKFSTVNVKGAEQGSCTQADFKRIIDISLDFLISHKQIIQVSVHDPYFEYIL